MRASHALELELHVVPQVDTARLRKIAAVRGLVNNEVSLQIT